jgi:hypothetical protein
LVEVGELFEQASQPRKMLLKALGNNEEQELTKLQPELDQLKAELEKAVEILEGALKLKPNAGGAIKEQIKRSLKILKSQSQRSRADDLRPLSARDTV